MFFLAGIYRFPKLLGVKVLSQDAVPLSSLIGLAALARDPAPLLGIPVLLKSKPKRL